jgi:hypothetical protein
MMLMRNSFCFTCVILLIHFFLLSIAGIQTVAADTQPSFFSTWEGFEVDKCASIWLIKRFVDKEAVIKFYPKGEPIEENIPFDTPDAKFRRYHNMSTFESILRHYQLADPNLVYMGKIIHDIEVNVWERKLMQETYRVQEEVNKIISESTGNNEIINESVKYFDALYKEISIHKP